MPREVKWAISFLIGAVLLWFGWRFYAFLVVLHVAVCFVLMGVILLQSGQAADIAGAFGGSGSQTAFGPRGAATFLSRATTWCAVMFMFTSMALAVHVRTTSGGAGRSILEQFSRPAPKSAAPAPVNPSQLPPAQPAAPPPAAPAPSAPGPAK
ncbi:MAG TPA: preprotein translocase subunit SecG [Candidatus Acidoferrales bacterium]|jgi:preprotein translocase subunit SecG|nr:preprotein translocase subunit SecG [Candidatus Acidoferrales bacterium]